MIQLKDAAGNFRPLEEITLDIIFVAIKESGGNLSAAADALSIGRSTLYRRCKHLVAEARDGHGQPFLWCQRCGAGLENIAGNLAAPCKGVPYDYATRGL